MKEVTSEQLYKRQTTLTEIGDLGQEKLLQSKVVIVGCGGLGSVAAVYLAASGVGTIHLIDYDLVDTSNLHRQVFYRIKDVGRSKAEVLKNHIKSISPFVDVSSSNNAISKNNVFKEIDFYDFVLDCTDSLPTKYLLNDACVIQNKTLIYGSLYKFDGYVASFNIKLPDGNYSANLRDAFPNISQEVIPNCSEIGTLNTIVGVIGLMQANEVLKLVTGVGKPLINQLLIYNSSENSQYKIKLKSIDKCNSDRKKRISEIFENETYVDAACEVQDEELLISAEELKKELSLQPKIKKLKIISIVENTDVDLPFKVDDKIPFSKFDVDNIQLSPDKKYVIICNKGITSYTATLMLSEKYPNIKVLSLKNGIINY